MILLFIGMIVACVVLVMYYEIRIERITKANEEIRLHSLTILHQKEIECRELESEIEKLKNQKS